MFSRTEKHNVLNYLNTYLNRKANNEILNVCEYLHDSLQLEFESSKYQSNSLIFMLFPNSYAMFAYLAYNPRTGSDTIFEMHLTDGQSRQNADLKEYFKIKDQVGIGFTIVNIHVEKMTLDDLYKFAGLLKA